MAWQTPKTDWTSNPKSPMAEDFNRIEGNIAHILNEIEVKKGAIVNAVNTKRVNVTLENSYSEIAAAINSINLNHRVANGTTTLTKYGTITTEEQIGDVARSLRFVVNGLPFKPSKVFVRGAFRARINNSSIDQHPYYITNSVVFKYGIVSNALVEDRRYGTYLSAGGGMAFFYETYARITHSVTFQDDGFTITLTAQEPSSYPQLWEIADSGGIQYWFAEE